MKQLSGCIFFCFAIVAAHAQNPIADFDIPADVCRSQNIVFQNQSENATSYQWDFCPHDFDSLSVLQNLVSISGFSAGYGYKLVEDNGMWYGFAVQRALNGVIYRLDFGDSPFNVPTVFNLGNPNNTLALPISIDIYKDDDRWYGFVGLNNTDVGIVRLDFGTSLTNTPTGQNIGTFGITGRLWDVKVVSENGNLILVIVRRTTSSSIVRINYRDSFNNSISNSEHVYNSEPNANIGIGVSLDVAKIGNDWIVLTTSNSNNSVVQFRFTPSILSSPIQETIYTNVSINQPLAVRILQEGSRYVAAITNQFANVQLVDFHDFNPTNTPTKISHNSLPSLLAVSVYRYQGKSLIHGTGTNNIVRGMVFKSYCDASYDFSQGDVPSYLQYAEVGNKDIELRAYDEDGLFSVTSHGIEVSSSIAPDISFSSQNFCVQYDVNFTFLNQSADIVNYQWNFDDYTTSSEANPAHIYTTASTYYPSLTITSTNGCQNFVRKTLTIYNQPVADFTTPSVSPLCTNQNFVFDNTTADVGYPSVWEWSINAVPVASSEDLTYVFTSTANQEVKLKASIPGCESEKTINITTLIAGPKPDFTVTGQCEDASIVFTNTSSGTVTGYTWDFDDGQTSTLVNPVNVFANPGVYDVVLTASNASGCNNTALKQVTIYSSPQVNFMALAPPFSCSGTPTQFNDLTPPPPDSNLSSWSWNFGDTGSPSNTSTQRNPQHMYATAADYTVALTVTTNFSCSKTFQKNVTIHQTPTAAFNHSALCEDTGVTFSDAASTNQAWSWQIGSSFYFTENVEHIFTNPGNYTVIFSATGSNNCVGSTTQPVVIPTKLNVDFSTLRTCVNQEAEFTDLTNDSSDPITDVSWNFGGLGTAATTPATFIFPETGTVNVTLTVTTQSGCAYPVTKPTGITEGPLAAFTATPNTGEAPLTVQFTNTSLDANTFNWKFNAAGSASTQPSPSFIYVNAGDFIAELIARDLKSCADTTRQLIEVLEPAELNHPSPNPSKGTFTFEWKTNEATKTAIVLVDATGREVRNFEVMSNAGINRYILDITGEQPGFYILNIRYLNTLKTYKLMLSE